MRVQIGQPQRIACVGFGVSALCTRRSCCGTVAVPSRCDTFPLVTRWKELQAAEAIRCNDNSLRPCDVAGPGRHTMRDAPAPRRAAPAAFALWRPGWWCFAYERGADRLDLDGRCLADSTHMIMGSPLKWGRVSSVPLPWWPAFFFFEKITGNSRYCFSRNRRWAGGFHAFQSGQRTWTWDR